MRPSRAAVLAVFLPAVAFSTQPVPAAFDQIAGIGVYSSLKSAAGDSVQYEGLGPMRCAHQSTGDACVQIGGRHSVDLETGAIRVVEEPPAARPCYKEVSRGNNDFELLDDAGKSRYRGSYRYGPDSRVDPACRRFVYVSRRGQLTVVDLRTFRDEELGKVTVWDANERVIFAEDYGAKESRNRKFLYDYRSGRLCEGSDPYLCLSAPTMAEPALDAWHRPQPATARLENKRGEPGFELVDAAGNIRVRGSFLIKYGDPAYSISPDGRWFAFLDRSSVVKLVDLKDFTTRTIHEGDEMAVPRFSTGGRYLMAGITIYEVESARKTQIPYEAMHSSPDDRWSLLDTEEGGALYSFAAGTTTAVITPMKPRDVLFSPSGRYVFFRAAYDSRHSDRPTLAVHEMPGGRRVASSTGEVYDKAFSPDERFLAILRSNTNWKHLELWDLRYGAMVAFDFPEQRYSFGFKFTGNGRWLAISTGDALKAWRLRRGQIQRGVLASLLDAEAAIAGRLKRGRAGELSASAAAYAEKAKALRPSKGEFESAVEYAVRMKAADEQDALLSREAEGEASRVAAAWDIKVREEGGRARETVEAALDEEIAETAKVALGAYDADAQEFAATFAIDEATRAVRVSVARKDAPAAKGRSLEAAVVYRHRLENGKPAREDLRVSVSDPVLGEVYSWSSAAGTARRARSAPAAPARLELKAGFSDADGDGRLTSGETAKLTVTVANSGAGAAYGVSASLEPSSVDGLSYAARHFIGEVPAGASRTATIPVKALAGVADASRALTVSAADANGFTADPFRVVFETRARRGARLILAEFKIKEAGGDGVVTPGELVEVLMRLRNDGAGGAEAASVVLSGQGGDLFVQGEARRMLGALAPGQTAEARFTVFSNTSHSGDKMRFSAALSEGSDTWEAPVEIPLRRALGATRELVVKGKDLPAAATAEAAEKPTARGAPRADAYAVILGAEDYPKAARVSHARRDAGAFRQFAVRVLGVPDDPSHLFFLDDGVTLAELRKAFSPNGWLARRVGPESDVFVFYAGHGAPSLDGKGAYLVPQDGDPNYAVETGFLVDDMLKALEGSKARSATVWLDACFSGADREKRPLLADARPLMLKADIRVPDGKVALYSAASGAEVSSAYPDKRHGLFTWFSMRGLDGEADADKDGALTAGELADFLSRTVSKTAGSLDREQTPGFRGDRARVLVQYRRSAR